MRVHATFSDNCFHTAISVVHRLFKRKYEHSQKSEESSVCFCFFNKFDKSSSCTLWNFGLPFSLFSLPCSTPRRPSILHFLPTVVEHWLVFEVENQAIPFYRVNSIWDSWARGGFGATCCAAHIVLYTRRRK